MANYVWNSTDESGKIVIREVNGNTSSKAKAALLAASDTGLSLMATDASAAEAGFFAWPLCGEESSAAPQHQLPPPSGMFHSARHIKTSMAAFGIKFYRWLRLE